MNDPSLTERTRLEQQRQRLSHALATATEKDPTGNRDVKSVLLEPQLITKDNVKTVISEGQVKASEVCVAATQAACGQLGIQ